MSELKKVASGKVREVFDLDDNHLVIVSTDRISAFDVVMDEIVEDRGRVLTALTDFWLTEVAKDLPNHLVTSRPSSEILDGVRHEVSDPEGRTMVVRKAQMIPIEFIVRGALAGSGWKEYQEKGTLHGQTLPEGLQLGSRLPVPVLTPSTKGELGEHDINLTMEDTANRIGAGLLGQCEKLALDLYTRGALQAEEAGFLLADTKFEFGFIDDELAVCDEVMTPDSSRYWPASGWELGNTPPAYDKQLLRDWLETQPWDKTSPAPTIPHTLLFDLRALYIEIYERIANKSFHDWLTR